MQVARPVASPIQVFILRYLEPTDGDHMGVQLTQSSVQPLSNCRDVEVTQAAQSDFPFWMGDRCEPEWTWLRSEELMSLRDQLQAVTSGSQPANFPTFVKGVSI
jgi:hypothetical protein